MGGEQADRTLFVGNLHPKATEELLFELFLQEALMFLKIQIMELSHHKEMLLEMVKHQMVAVIPDRILMRT